MLSSKQKRVFYSGQQYLPPNCGLPIGCLTYELRRFTFSGVDPKSVLCAFFKSGQCKKGDKCKFSHDLNVARKSEKKNIYGDGEPGTLRVV